MLVILAPKINYFNSLRIKEECMEIADQLKVGEEWNIKKSWEKITEILSSPII
jgi:hypothetical protein